MIKTKLLKEGALPPKRSTIESAGNDIFAPETIVIGAKQVATIELPFVFEGDLDKYEATVYVRSSFGLKKKQRMVTKEGKKEIHGSVLELGAKKYEIHILNDTEEELTIEKGEHFAQIVITEKGTPKEKQKIEWLTEEEIPNGKIQGHMEVIAPNVYTYVVDEKLTFEKGEQKTLSTGVRSVIENGTYTAIDIADEVKHVLMLGNQRGIVDCDYAYNESTKGNCFLGVLNLKDEEVVIAKGTPIAIFFTEKYVKLATEEEVKTVRTGGVGHTSK